MGGHVTLRMIAKKKNRSANETQFNATTLAHPLVLEVQG